jgi:acetyltransferase-like isoleucine patch superfamily enzyme
VSTLPPVTSRRARVTARLADHRRDRAWRRLRRAGLTPPPPHAFGAFGRSYIVAPSRVSSPEHIYIGDDIVIHEDVWLSVVPSHADITPRLTIGDRTRIGRFCQISCVGRIDIGRDVIVSDHVHIGDTFHEYRDPEQPIAAQGMSIPERVEIGDGALIGMGAVVLAGVTVGARAYVSEGSVVTSDVAPGATVSGNPAALVAPARTP